MIGGLLIPSAHLIPEEPVVAQALAIASYRIGRDTQCLPDMSIGQRSSEDEAAQILESGHTGILPRERRLASEMQADDRPRPKRGQSDLTVREVAERMRVQQVLRISQSPRRANAWGFLLFLGGKATRGRC